MELLVSLANLARRYGIVSLDAELSTIQNRFTKKVVVLAVDRTEPQELRKIVELELSNQSDREERLPQVFESAGGFSPTIGIMRGGTWPDPGNADLDKIDESGWHRSGVCCDYLWGRCSQSALLARCGKVTNPFAVRSRHNAKWSSRERFPSWKACLKAQGLTMNQNRTRGPREHEAQSEVRMA